MKSTTLGTGIASGGIAGAIVTLIAYGVSLKGVQLPDTVVIALTTLIYAGTHTLLAHLGVSDDALIPAAPVVPEAPAAIPVTTVAETK